MKGKKLAINSISGVVILAVVLVYALVTDDEALLGRLVETVVSETLLPALDDATNEEIITIKIANDGDIIKHGRGMSLAGELDFTGQKGDTLVFQKQGDFWIEIGRYLVED
jgi:hypothetical protein